SDVEFTINLIKNPASNANRFIKKNVSLIESVNVIDPLHVVITLTRPVDDPAFILGFPILPKHMQNKMGSNGIQRNSPYSVDPAGGGSGKYMFRSAMFSGPINLTRNADYYGNKAYIERIKVGIQPLYDQIANNLLFEGIHFAIELPPRYLDFFTAAGKHYLRDYNSLAFQYIGHNYDNPILKNKDIRKAITLGTDRVNMLKMVYLNRGVILSGPYAPSDPGFNVNVQPIGYDPNAAVKLLESCGYKLIDNDGIRHNGKDRLSFNLRVIADKETTNEVAILFQGNMKAIGIDIRIEHYPRQRWQEIAQAGDFDMILGEKEYNAFAEIATIFDSNEIGPNGINYSRFRSSTIDSLLTDLFNATTAEGRKLIKWNLHEAINEEQPYTFLWSVNKTAVFRNCVRRVRIQPFEFFTYINEWWIDQDMENQK
ncbi:ABC transporter substrate-binding protein, partial [bacterium]|nr:ABC transporter substrate-binding protein [bacterium]